jgi:hypothetical protein
LRFIARLLPECPGELSTPPAEPIKFCFKVRFGVGAFFLDKAFRLNEQQAGVALVIFEPYFGTDGDVIGSVFGLTGGSKRNLIND